MSINYEQGVYGRPKDQNQFKKKINVLLILKSVNETAKRFLYVFIMFENKDKLKYNPLTAFEIWKEHTDYSAIKNS